MDFNMKKLASDAGIFFTRAVQVRPGAMLLAGPGCGARPSTLLQYPLPCCCGGACWGQLGPLLLYSRAIQGSSQRGQLQLPDGPGLGPGRPGARAPSNAGSH